MAIIRRAASLLQAVQIVIALLLIAACVAGLPFGLLPYIVASGSMEPEIQTGSLAYVDRGGIAPETVTAGDIITYRLPAGQIVTHRVVDNDHDSEQFTTKGDANARADRNPVPYDDMIGVTLFSLPLLGLVLAYIQTHPMLVAVVLAIVNIALWLLSRPPNQEDGREVDMNAENTQEETPQPETRSAG